MSNKWRREEGRRGGQCEDGEKRGEDEGCSLTEREALRGGNYVIFVHSVQCKACSAEKAGERNRALVATRKVVHEADQSNIIARN